MGGATRCRPGRSAPHRDKAQVGELLEKGQGHFATDLLAQPEPLRREVIVHELLHLKVPNHGPIFRALLSAREVR